MSLTSAYPMARTHTHTLVHLLKHLTSLSWRIVKPCHTQTKRGRRVSRQRGQRALTHTHANTLLTYLYILVICVSTHTYMSVGRGNKERKADVNGEKKTKGFSSDSAEVLAA